MKIAVREIQDFASAFSLAKVRNDSTVMQGSKYDATLHSSH